VAALILGIVGSVTGISSLIWQVISWRRAGPVVRLSASSSFFKSGIAITAFNTGRSDVTVNNLIVPLRDGKAWPIAEGMKGLVITEDHFPHRLEAGTSARCDVDARIIRAALDNIRPKLLIPDRRLKIGAVLGNSKRVDVDVSHFLDSVVMQEDTSKDA
jgi:phosphatidylserine/phosphatidylglycerophosphate/cardiolipin synthase-like enzyme